MLLKSFEKPVLFHPNTIPISFPGNMPDYGNAIFKQTG